MNDYKKPYRVRESVYPTTETLQFLCLKLSRVQGNRIIFTEHGIRQVSFLYGSASLINYVNLRLGEVYEIRRST